MSASGSCAQILLTDPDRSALRLLRRQPKALPGPTGLPFLEAPVQLTVNCRWELDGAREQALYVGLSRPSVALSLFVPRTAQRLGL